MQLVTLRSKILISILGALLLGILITVILNSITVSNFSKTSADTTYNAMKEEELSSLNRLVKDKALLVDEYLSAVISDINMAAEFASDLFNGKINATTRDTYWADSAIDQRIPSGPIIDDYFGLGKASWEVSTIYMPTIVSSDAYQSISSSAKSIINQSSNLDFIFKAMHASNPDYIWIYMGFEENNLFRQLPWNDMSWAREDLYKPTQEEWYTNAVAEDGINLFLDKDPESGLVVTTSKPIKDQNGELIGVISVDLPIAIVETSIVGASILENGYAYMLDGSGNTVIHPVLIDDVSQFGNSIIDLEFNNKKESSEFTSILSKITSGETGQSLFKKNGKNWFVSFAPVKAAEFSVVLAVPESDILLPANKIKSEIKGIFIQKMLLFILLTTFISAGIFYYASITSKKIVEPVHELTQVTELITRGDLSKDLHGVGGGSKEVTLLFNTFKGLVTALRFGNEDYYAGNIDRAMKNYQNALDLFTTLNNQKGIGICYNNIGNIHKARGNLKDANHSYRKAIEIGEQLLTNASPDNRIIHIHALASRYSNLALLYKDIEEYEKAEELIIKALDLDREIDNARGFATRYGNLGLLHLSQGKTKEAKDAFDEAYEIADARKSERALAYATMNYGTYERTIGNTDKAIEYFLKATELATDLDVRVASSSLKNIQEIYEERGEKDLADEINKKLREIGGITRSKEVTFVLDYSGSMAGRRIKAAVKGMERIFKDQIFSRDLVSLILFDSTSKVLIKPVIKEGNEKSFMRAFQKLRYPEGATAFYDALGKAFKDFLSRPTPNEQWIIALTDGDDNSSQRYNPNEIGKQARKSIGVNLVIIGVGELRDREILEDICSATDRGTYIDEEDGVADAITTAFEEVSSMLSEVEVEGFIPDH